MSNYPPSLEKICMRALERRRNIRYQTAQEMRRELLDASRILNEGKVPEESLSRVMHKLFIDRIEQKRRMLASIREGGEITHVPTAETDAQIELPGLSMSEANGDIMAGSQSSISIHSKALNARDSSRKAWWVGAIAAGLLVIAGTGAMTVWTGASADAQQERALAQQEVVQTNVAPPLSPKVKVRIETQPAAVTVMLGGQNQGETPIELELERSEQAIELAFARDGFVGVTQVVTPNVDQLLRLSLAQVQTPPVEKSEKVHRVKKKRRGEKTKAPENDDSPYTRFN
jgi:hypothetical protein